MLIYVDWNNRCSPHRGQAVAPTTILNLTDPQFVLATDKQAAGTGPYSNQQRQRNQPPALNSNAKFARGTPGGPSIVPANGRLPAGGFHPAPVSHAASKPFS
jgi:hypothetical protein